MRYEELEEKKLDELRGIRAGIRFMNLNLSQLIQIMERMEKSLCNPALHEQTEYREKVGMQC